MSEVKSFSSSFVTAGIKIRVETYTTLPVHLDCGITIFSLNLGQVGWHKFLNMFKVLKHPFNSCPFLELITVKSIYAEIIQFHSQ